MKLDKNLLKKIIQKLKEKKITISFAESITGGNAAASLVFFSGSSNYFNSSIVTYTNEQKIKLLNVKEITLSKYGAISEQTAYEMALNLKNKTESDICISFTGNAGPIVHENKKVGLTFITLVIFDKFYNYKFESNQTKRSLIIIDTINFAFAKLNNLLL
ncbi:/ / competence/damage-inducible protein CinA / 103072:103551 Forward [Candidatus Hepatoplasma crinochetorum]|uniref:/ / competence/damage-inducible protein CinA / 103072:103551 Forward n=1 Tax=Candidatus Hepatoplasma crinochetorum TaxID=295596 RepID=A0A0G7ZNE7_9MOLU|nr:/ / competence/damage-inducible protein CinA / 103072:103551 Forward [Candidatus Hepatoplasma crinochetorum]